jgi:hypothetical protein
MNIERYIEMYIECNSQIHFEAVLHIIGLIFCWCMIVQNNDMMPATSQYYV